MQRLRRPKIIAQNDADVDAPEGIDGLDSGRHPERRRHRASPVGLAAAHDDAGLGRRGIRVAEEDDVDALPPQDARADAGEALPAGAVQHLDDDASPRRRDSEGVIFEALGARPEQRDHRAAGQHERDDQRDAAPEATRAFQNR